MSKRVSYQQNVTNINTGLWTMRKKSESGGWFERGSYGTAYGYVVVYRQSDPGHTTILFIVAGRLYERCFTTCLSDASLKIQCGRLAKDAYQEERGKVGK